MSSFENPIILRQSFVKLWANNIYLPETRSDRLQFISLLKTKLASASLMHYRYQRVISTRTSKGDIDLDEYKNVYKYQKNERRVRIRWKRSRYRKKMSPNQRARWKSEQRRKPKEGDERRFALQNRFKKAVIYSQMLSDFSESILKTIGLLFRFRQALRHLSFVDSYFGRHFYMAIPFLAKQKYFINTVYHIILLHYYKAVTSFSQHFGRELQKVRKKVHWKLINGFRTLLDEVPSHPALRRQFYGITVEIAGRPKGRSRTFIFRLSEGTIAPQTFRFRVSFGYGEAFAKVGLFGIRTWIAY